MKIVHVTYSLSHGGIGTILGQLANRQAKNNDVIIVVVCDIVAEEKLSALDSNINVILLNKRQGSLSVKPLFLLNKYLKELNADIYHFHSGEIIKYLSPFVWWKIKKKSCVTLHCVYPTLKSVKKGRLFKFLHRFAISNAVKDILYSVSGLSSTVICNGVECSKFKQKIGRWNVPFKILQIGRLIHNVKGQDLLLDAVADLTKKGFSNIHVTFLGGVGSSLDFLKARISEYSQNDIVTFIEPKDHKYIEQHLCDYDLLVQPSRTEGFGLTVAEAMSAKVPVLVSNLPALLEVIDDGKCGYSFDIKKDHDFSNQLIKIINNGPDSNMLERGWIRVNQLYSVDSAASSYLSEYKKS